MEDDNVLDMTWFRLRRGLKWGIIFSIPLWAILALLFWAISNFYK
jgi:hypothetical protein